LSTTDAIPAGLCQCGCGQKTPLAKQSDTARKMVRGQPIRFVHGHNARKAVHYLIEDRGYETPCWIWQLAVNKDGHGFYTGKETRQMAHRMHYERVHGTLPPGVHLHHRCEVPPCVNPGHLEPLTPAEHKQEHSRLTWEIVGDIRTQRERGVALAVLSEQFGLSMGHVSEICNYKAWKETAA
jgi:hypothetical protein